MFREVERAALLPLPRERFPFFHEAQRKVNRDGHVEVAKAYYSVPPEYLARTVWVRWDARLVRIFNHRFEQIAAARAARAGPVQHARRAHLPRRRSAAWSAARPGCLNKVQRDRPADPGLGRGDARRARHRRRAGAAGAAGAGEEALPTESLEKACEIALSHGAFRLRTLRQLLERDAPPQQPLPFLDEHPHHPAARRLRPDRRGGAPAPTRSLIPERRFSKA